MATKNVTIKNRNSIVPGRAPTTSDLVLGELSINHEDGKLYALHTTSGSVDGVVQLNAGGGSALTVKDEGTNLSTATSSINFVGAGVTATNTGSDVTVTISGGAFDQSNVAITGGSISGVALSTPGDAIIHGQRVGVGQSGNTDNLVMGLDPLNSLLAKTDENDFSKSFNVALGIFTLNQLQEGANNLAIGALALQNLPSGYDNIGIGAHAGQFMTSGGNNIFIGTTAGGGDWMDSYLTSGNNNIFIGSSSRPLNNEGDSNCIVIGADNVGLGSNSTVIGTPATTKTKIYGDLEVTGAVTASSCFPAFARTGTNSERLSFTPQLGEFFFCTDTKIVWIGDGATLGGIQVTGGGSAPPTLPNDFGSFSNDAATADFGSFSNDAMTEDFGTSFTA